MAHYLIYHPKRCVTPADDLLIYHDRFGDDEDPYIWNEHFLHTFCHITQLPNEPGQINFWASSENFRQLNELRCDCVFVVDQKIYWPRANHIDADNPIVDTPSAFQHHYQWVNPPYNHHHFQRRRRYTLKATADTSFQSQESDRRLVDILPFLATQGLSRSEIKKGITATRGAKPMALDEAMGGALYHYLEGAHLKLIGARLTHLHPNQPLH